MQKKISIIQGICDYFMWCDLLEDGVFRVYNIGDEPIEYAIENDVFNPVVLEYADGSKDCQHLFNFVSRNLYSIDRCENIKNSEFYENLYDWVSGMNMKGEFPAMPEDCTPYALECVTQGYIMDSSMKYGRYQIQMRLRYIKAKPVRK